MTVRELRQKLAEMDQDAEVVLYGDYADDDPVVPSGVDPANIRYGRGGTVKWVYRNTGQVRKAVVIS